MKAALVYFSGTGNTKRLSDMFKKHFESQGISTDAFNVDDYIMTEKMLDLSPYGYIGFGYPIHAFAVPLPVMQGLKKLPSSSGQTAFIFKTAGEPFPINHFSSKKLIRVLTKKGFHVVFERHFLMPYNIMFRYPDALVKQMVVTNEKLSLGMTKAILAGETHQIKASALAYVLGAITRFFKDYGVMLNGKFFLAAKKKCNLCNLCVRTCPVHNITRKGNKIVFGWRCMLCMRCVMGCPKDAIYIGILSPWILHGFYEFKRILNDPDISDDYVNENTKGYFKAFLKYYRWADETIEKELG